MPSWFFPQEALNPTTADYFLLFSKLLSLLGTFSTFVSGGVVQLFVTLVTLSISHSPVTAITCSYWAPSLPSHPLSFVPLKQHVCSQAKKAAMAAQFWALHESSKLTEKFQQAWSQICVGACGWLNGVVWIVVIRTIIKPVSECSELQPNKLSWTAVQRKIRSILLVSHYFMVFPTTPSSDRHYSQTVYSHVNTQNQMQDWIYNNIINISEKYDVVQIPRVPQGILKKWKEITCESQRAFLLA